MSTDDASGLPLPGHGLYRLSSCGGAFPTQADGRLADGRPFYFRARHGAWTLSVGEDPSWPECYSDWPEPPGPPGLWQAGRWEVADGEDPTGGVMEVGQVVAVLDAWCLAQWDGVPEAALWAGAGFSPDRARELLSLPEGHPDRPGPEALAVTGVLRREAAKG